MPIKQKFLRNSFCGLIHTKSTITYYSPSINNFDLPTDSISIVHK